MVDCGAVISKQYDNITFQVLVHTFQVLVHRRTSRAGHRQRLIPIRYR